MRFAACTLAAAACAVVLGGSADSARTQGGAAWNLKPVASGQKWLRVEVSGDTLYGFRLRGTDFTITGIKSVRASGGPTPQCSVSGSPATLACDGELPGGISVFVQLDVSGSGGSYEFAFLFQPGDTNLLYIPSNQTPAPALLGGTFGRTAPTAGRVTVTNPSKTKSFQQLEIEPIGFRITGVATADCAVTEGGGVACQKGLGPGGTAVVRVVIDPFSGQLFTVLLAHGTDTGFILVPEGDPCADLKAKIAQLQAEAGALKARISATQKELDAAKQALRKARNYLRGTLLPGANQKQARQKVAEAEKRVEDAQGSLEKLKQKLGDVEEEIRARQRHLKICQSGGERAKTAAANACDTEGSTLSRAAGKVRGLALSLTAQRQIASKARPAIVLMKQVGPLAGPSWRPAVAHLTTLSVLPGRTQGALLSAAKTVASASSALEQCERSLQQD